MLNSVTCTTLLNLVADSLPARPAEAVHMHPDAHRLAYQVCFRDIASDVLAAQFITVPAEAACRCARRLAPAIPYTEKGPVKRIRLFANRVLPKIR